MSAATSSSERKYIPFISLLSNTDSRQRHSVYGVSADNDVSFETAETDSAAAIPLLTYVSYGAMYLYSTVVEILA